MSNERNYQCTAGEILGGNKLLCYSDPTRGHLQFMFGRVVYSGHYAAHLVDGMSRACNGHVEKYGGDVYEITHCP